MDLRLFYFLFYLICFNEQKKISIITVLQTFVLANPMKKTISVSDIDFTHSFPGKRNLTQNQNQYKKKTKVNLKENTIEKQLV